MQLLPVQWCYASVWYLLLKVSLPIRPSVTEVLYQNGSTYCQNSFTI